MARQVEGFPVVGDHLLLGPAEEVAGARRLRQPPDRLPGRERLRIEEPPEVVVGQVPAHVRRRGQEQEMTGGPTESAEPASSGQRGPASASASR